MTSMKRRELMSPSQLYTNFSWEKAFAEDTAGDLGGVVWPPRSYWCSFCSREFRSAQALGGHMNVHRRDRARLKQSLVTTATNTAATGNEVQVLQRQNPNFSTPVQLTILSRLSSAMSSSKESSDDGHFVPCPSQSFLDHKGSIDLPLGKEVPICDRDNGCCDTNLSIGLSNSIMGDRANADAPLSFKRPKTGSSSPMSLLHKPCSTDCSCPQRLPTGLKIGYTEDLDLELRLGNPPKVK